MDNLDDSEKNAKISDSAYSNSCSNSHSRRSLSSKSTRSGSNSSGSGSSGYCGKPLAYSDNSGQPAEKRIKEKDGKKKKQIHVEQITEDPAESEERPHDEPSVAEEVSDETCNVARTTPPPQDEVEKGSELMDISPDRSSIKDEVRSLQRDGSSGNTAHYTSTNFATSRTAIPCAADGFSCVISMEDGVVMYTTASLTATLGFPKEMWIGRSFIDFIHPRDRNTFASHITNGLAVPKNVNAPAIQNAVYTMVCRIRRYRNLSTGFGVKERVLAYMPFFLKLSFKKIADEEGKVIYLVVQATPFFSAFKTPNELIKEPVPFVIRHAANGNLEYIDPESVPYLGYLPHDLADKDALQLYHPDDLPYLRLIYETIVKEGGLPRSKPYRILAQNGDFIKVETEWSSFINPWSRKLEFVIGKHHIIEGPNNPDVFQTPDADKVQKISEEEKNRIAKLRESIVLIMNEVLTKPAEAAKQQMTKRCQDLASFMESLMEEQQPKMEEELRLEIQDPENSYYERDSVMLGGISPHHDHHDSKSSTETPISYNQLNYNKTLQRYFDSHQPFTYEDYSANSGTDNVLTLKNINGTGNCLSPMAQNSRDSGELSSNESGCLVGGCSPMTVLGEYPSIRLTESLLSKRSIKRHNTEMEKELMKIHRESRSGTKDEREKASNKTRQKKKEHLARCNAAFQPTSVINIIAKEPQQHGVKRGSKQPEAEVPGAHKHHCPSPRQPRRHQSTSAALTRPAATVTTTAGQFAMPTATTSTTQQWPACPVNGMNTFILGMGIPPQMSIMSPVAAMPGMIPMYYAPAPAAQPEPIASTSNMPMPNNTMPSNPMPMPSSPQFHPPMPCMMYGQAVYGPPFMYSSINPQIHQYALTQNLQAQSTQTNTSSHPLGLASSNYEEACKQTAPVKPRSRTGSLWREKKLKTQHTSNGSAADSSTSSNACNRQSTCLQSKETAPTGYGGSKPKGSEDRTDGESSYSSFYSSFFKTESGSAEDSGDLRKSAESNDRNALSTVNKHYEPPQVKNFARRKMDPPWMEQVCVTSELIYKYQILTRNMEEVLQADRLKMSTLEQPSLVNEQLGQLYLDLQLEGVASRLSLEEGITSSSSSGEENSTVSSKCRKKREYSKLVMIYEEDAPLPPPPPPEDIPIITITPSSSTAAPNS
ncbi:period circadian protein isoform X4 [Pectinophora gossypiella]|nr:period circadian protein isoform X4 [Pectinophora gossypiella]